jgi:diguanylate cyclase (GGDEF)-like protein
VSQDLSAQRRKDQQLRTAVAQLEEQQRANEQLRRELQDSMLRDSATGLYTRAHFEDQLRREVDLSNREHREFAMVLIALDPASERVAAMGPPAQSRVLEAVGRLLRGNTRAMDASCRLDEQRFAVLLSGVGLATAHSRMEGLRRQCATQIVAHEGQELGFTVSMGVASFPHTAHSQDELMAACEAALRVAQRRGGNHVTLASIRFDPA